MELISTLVTAERVAEAVHHHVELSRQVLEMAKQLNDVQNMKMLDVSQRTLNQFPEVMNDGHYNRLAEAQQRIAENPSAAAVEFNDKNTLGQLGECLVHSNLSQYGDVSAHVPVDGASGPSNVLDLQFQSHSNMKLTELQVHHGEVVQANNYDIHKGDTAAFEVKNGQYDYFRSQVTGRHVLEQAQAGAQASDHSFVVINDNTAQELMTKPQGAELVRAVNDAGAKVIVGLPDTATQKAILLSA